LFAGSDKLSYLLEHRGYTHTVIGCVVLASLLYLCGAAWVRYKRYDVTWRDRLSLFAVALFGTMLHLFMDYLNSYGVHPYWPFDDAWYYGDSVFIVEPFYWIAAAPMFHAVRTTLARIALAIALVSALLAANFAGGGDPLWILAIALVTGVLFFCGKRVSARAAVFMSASLMVGITAVFVGAGDIASAKVEALAAKSFPGERAVDHVLSPEPMNPLCWNVQLISISEGRYTIRNGMLSNAPELMPAESCRRVRGAGETTAPLSEAPVASSDEIRWFGEFSMETSRLATLVERYCEASALMQFARAPFAMERKQGWVIGDLRFDNEADLGFAEVQLGAGLTRSCKSKLPWIPPRLDLLRQPES
jgi:inner membrane protein